MSQSSASSPLGLNGDGGEVRKWAERQVRWVIVWQAEVEEAEGQRE
jgi:hypothetical protein